MKGNTMYIPSLRNKVIQINCIQLSCPDGLVYIKVRNMNKDYMPIYICSPTSDHSLNKNRNMYRSMQNKHTKHTRQRHHGYHGSI